MTDARDAQIERRFAPLREELEHPAGWADVERRALAMEGGRGPARVSRRRRTRTAFGGALAVAAVAGAIAFLFAAGLPGRNATTADPTQIETVRYAFTSVETLPAVQGSPPSPVRTRHDGTFEVDFGRKIARVIGTGSQPAREVITTESWSYARLPPARRTNAGGKEWVRYPTAAENAAILTPTPFGDPVNARLPGPFPAGVVAVRVGEEIVDGRLLMRHVARDGANTYTIWTDERGWLARSELRLDGEHGLVGAASRFEYNLPLAIDVPSPSEAIEVATEEDAIALGGF